VQVGHHLATVAHAQGEAVVALEEGLEGIAGTAVEQADLAQPSPAPSTSP
jgi:hypothetical protein